MEHLRIKNFLLIEDADFEIGRFTVFIGSQASGKSVVAKVLYFFREFFYDSYYEMAMNAATEEKLKNDAIQQFIKIFPKYTWENQEGELNYHLNGFEMTLTIKYGNDVQICFSKSFIELQRELKEKLFDLEKAVDYLFADKLHESFKIRSLFIPASRSFFAMIQNNIFALLTRDIEIDYFVKRFGAIYQNYKSKERYKQGDKASLLVDTILAGRYQNEGEQDWLERDGKKTNLFYASSGQQEALPMLITLLNYPSHNFFIEEPEAHLFPVSQKHIISLFSWLYTRETHDFVITTHSPYILTAINNAILAHDVMTEKGEEAVKEFFDPEFAIKYEDVRAYTIENGRLSSILDNDTRLIGAEIIDSVSSEFETVFSDLLELQNS